MSDTFSLQFSEAIGWMTGRASDLYKVGYWYADADSLTGAVHVLQLQLSPPPASSLAQISPEWCHSGKFWY